MYKYDIIVIILVIIIVAIIVLINVKKTLNDKLSHVEIKIPEIDIPQPNIVVKVQRECDSDKFDVHIEKNNNIIMPNQKVGLSPIHNEQIMEHFTTNQQLKPILKMSETIKQTPKVTMIVPDEQNKEMQKNRDKELVKEILTDSEENKNTFLFNNKFYPTNEIKTSNKIFSEEEQKNIIQLIPQYNGNLKVYDDKTGSNQNLRFESSKQISGDKFVQFPNEENIVDYGNFVCIKKAEFNKINQANQQINFDPNKIKTHNEKTTQIILKNDNYDEDEEYDTMDYFLKHRQFIPSSFEDGVTRGSNIGQYGGFAGLNDIGKIKLGKNNFKYPKPNNYLFANDEK